MSGTWLTAREAAERLGITATSMYDWLARSNRGEFYLRGQQVTIDYLQGGARGQGRIRIADTEVERLLEAMRVRPQPVRPRRPPTTPHHFPGISVPLGRPPS
jgi:predicted site-specific integrase-resolvase